MSFFFFASLPPTRRRDESSPLYRRKGYATFVPQFSSENDFSTDASLYISHFSKEEKTFSSLSEEECDGDMYRLWNLWRMQTGYLL